MYRNPITPQGYDTLFAELQHHKQVLRPDVVRAIEEARAHGDLSENADYDAAKDRQGYIEGRIQELERLVASADIIDIAKVPRSSRAVFGTTVVLENPATGDKRTYRIVGESESDVKDGRLSWKSPLAKAVIGRSEGDEVTVPAPGGNQVWEIVEVRYE